MKVRDIRKRAKGKYESNGAFKSLRMSQHKRCKSYQQGCFVCDFWHFYDTHKRFPTPSEQMEMPEMEMFESLGE